MAFPPDDHWFQKFIEQQRQVEKLFGPISERIKQHQNLFESIKLPTFEYQNSILQQSHLRDYLSIAGFSKDYLSIHQDIEKSLGSISAITNQLEFLKKSTGFESILAAQENLYRFQDQFALTSDLFKLPSVRIESVLAAAEATSRLLSPQNIFSDFTLSSVAEYQSFLSRQYKHLQFDKDIIADRRIQITELSGGLFEIINASIEIGVALENQAEYQSEEIIHDNALKYGLYSQVNQHLGFAYSDRFSGEIETRFDKSTPARICRLGFAITEQIFKINSICETDGKPPVFKPTSQTMRACAIIPSLVARNETEFYQLIDYLFFLLYEGSGTGNRLTSITNISALDPLWKVKHLRLAARHDIDHGSSREIEKKRAKIREAYISLIAQPLPIEQNDWKKAQLQIYIEIDLMLQIIIQEIVKKIK